jgi:hypothetical protein
MNCYIYLYAGLLQDDIRNLIPISTFGFYKRGVLEVKIHSLFVKPLDLKKVSLLSNVEIRIFYFRN